jgi:hypothetical protein
MRTETVKVFAFDELDTEVQEKVLDKMREEHVFEYDWWENCEESILGELSEKYGIEAKGVYFDTNPRDASLAEPKFSDEEKLVREVIGITQEMTETELKDICGAMQIRATREGYGGYGGSRTEFELDASCIECPMTPTSCYEEDAPKQRMCGCEHAEERAKEIQEKLNEWLDKKLREYLKQLDEEAAYLQSDEALKETIASNEYEFTKDGARWN